MTLTTKDIRQMRICDLIKAVSELHTAEDAMKAEWWNGDKEFRKEVLAISGKANRHALFNDIVTQHWYPLTKEIERRRAERVERAKKDKLKRTSGDTLYVVVGIEVEGTGEQYSSRVSVTTKIELVTKDRDKAQARINRSKEDHEYHVEYHVLRAKEGIGSVDKIVEFYGHSE